jgi:hypothetical protein
MAAKYQERGWRGRNCEAAHILSDAKLPDIQADIKAWRCHIAFA